MRGVLAVVGDLMREPPPPPQSIMTTLLSPFY